MNAIIKVVTAGAVLTLAGCSTLPAGSMNPIVGTWFVTDLKAPFPYHMYVFNADGTMQQANPDAGHTTTSDSDGKGIWIAQGGQVRGKFVEITADRATHKFLSRGEISFVLTVAGDAFSGDIEARFYDADNKLVEGPFPTTPVGKRVTLP